MPELRIDLVEWRNQMLALTPEERRAEIERLLSSPVREEPLTDQEPPSQ